MVGVRREKRGAVDAANRPASAWPRRWLYMARDARLERAGAREVRDGLVRAGLPAATRFMVTPVVVNPFKREVVIDFGGRYEKGLVWFEPLPHFRPAGFGIETNLDDPAAGPRCRRRSRARTSLWSRFPFAAVEPSGIWLNDYRYANVGLGGWSAVKVVSRTQIQ